MGMGVGVKPKGTMPTMPTVPTAREFQRACYFRVVIDGQDVSAVHAHVGDYEIRVVVALEPTERPISERLRESREAIVDGVSRDRPPTVAHHVVVQACDREGHATHIWDVNAATPAVTVEFDSLSEAPAVEVLAFEALAGQRVRYVNPPRMQVD
jgi:hypothetical protein